LYASVNTPLLYLTALGPTSLNESDTGFVDVTVTRTYVSDISQSIVVDLSTDNPGAIQTSYGVWIEAGKTSATTRVYLTNDGEIDATQVAVVAPVKTGFRSQGVSYSVTNDDTASVKTLGGYLSGAIPAEQYRVIQHLRVADGQTMTIAPGTTLRFDSGIGLFASGKLLAQGTSAQPIIFTSGNLNPLPGDWSGIHVNSDVFSQAAILDNVDVSFASSGIQVYSGGSGGDGEATITNSNIHHNRFGIDVEGYNSAAYATITGNKIQHNEIIGINVYSEGTSTQSSEDGYASVTIVRNEISDNGIGVDVSSEGSAEFMTNAVSSGRTYATLKSNSIHHNNVGISAYSYAGAGYGIADASVSLTAYRNVISDNLTRGVNLIVSESGGFISTLVNNTIINNGQEGV